MDKNFAENVYALIGELKHFDYAIESIDHIWDIIFPHKTSRQAGYHYIRVTKYKETSYIGHMDGKLCSLEVQKNASVQAAPSFGSSHEDGRHDPAKAWDGLISSARNWLKIVKKDWIKANKQVWLSYPLNRRYGTVCNSLVRESLSEMYRIDQELGKAKTKKFIKLVEQGDVGDYHDAIIPSMTADDFFKYCKIAYIAGQRKDDNI